MTFVKRQITATITLGEGANGDTAGAPITLTNLRMSVNIAVAGGAAQGALQARIFGLQLGTINQLTQIGPISASIRRQNTIQIAAGDEGQPQSIVFEGVIRESYGDFQSAPEVALNIIANSALGAAIVPVGAYSWKGDKSVAEIMKTLADVAGFTFENNNVTVRLSNPYFPGTALTQIQLCAKAANINYSTENGVLAIWSKDGYRQGDIPLISSATTMVGYPAFTSNGLMINSLFIPTVKNGGLVQVESEIPIANGTWRVSNIIHHLETQKKNGAWFTQLGLYNKNG